MVRAVVQPHPHVLHRVTRNDALRHRLADALLDRGDEPGRDHAALDRVDELESLALRQRLDLDEAVAELPAAPGLLLVAPLRLRGPLDRLLVRHPRRLQVDLRAEALLHPVDDHLDVDLRESGDDLLARLRIAMEVDRRVLLLEAPQCGEHFVLVALGLRLHRERHHRRGQRRERELVVAVLCCEDVARVRLLELRDSADVPGPELVGVAHLLALRDEQLPDPLLRVGARIDGLRVVLDRALVDAEEVDAPGERIRQRLEHERDGGLVGVGVERLVAGLHAAAHDRRRQVLHERVEQAVRREVPGRDATGDREEMALGDALLQRRDELLVRDLLALEVALHQLVGVLGHLVEQLLPVLLGLRLELVRDRDLLAVFLLIAAVLVGLHVHEVDHAANLVL